mmetsp:Transcript_43966/g.140081  ORF Transcript_43966/g.140081 Transcript_43966/m.140081 type:complete len:228 (-) Transcript_43966:114-797(-)
MRHHCDDTLGAGGQDAAKVSNTRLFVRWILRRLAERGVHSHHLCAPWQTLQQLLQLFCRAQNTVFQLVPPELARSAAELHPHRLMAKGQTSCLHSAAQWRHEDDLHFEGAYRLLPRLCLGTPCLRQEWVRHVPVSDVAFTLPMTQQEDALRRLFAMHSGCNWRMTGCFRNACIGVSLHVCSWHVPGHLRRCTVLLKRFPCCQHRMSGKRRRKCYVVRRAWNAVNWRH